MSPESGDPRELSYFDVRSGRRMRESEREEKRVEIIFHGITPLSR